MHGIVALLLTVFLYGEQPVQQEVEPITTTSPLTQDVEKVVEMQGCQEEKVKLAALLAKDPKVRGYDIQCIYIPVKDKV